MIDSKSLFNFIMCEYLSCLFFPFIHNIGLYAILAAIKRFIQLTTSNSLRIYIYSAISKRTNFSYFLGVQSS